MKYYILNEAIDLQSSTVGDKNLKQLDIYDKLKKVKRAYIYGNGGMENIVKASLKSYLFDVGILAETYAGAQEIVAFDRDLLRDSLVVVVDFSKDDRTREIMFQLDGIDCVKILVGSDNNSIARSDYSIFLPENKTKLRLISPYIIELEEFFRGYLETLQ